MKINYLKLKNFSSIETAMNASEIYIDFRKAENKVILLVGPNGSGKTSVLSQLTPFATVGGLDVRNGNDLIIDGKDGYKEIQFVKKDDVYTIKHFYTNKKTGSHSVKSYISKNGKELNNNGNVSSFKEIVKEELYIEMDYLKLIRVGSNVTSMIDLTAAERKNFMNKLLSDADIFLAFYKKVNQNMRQLKDMISHDIDKQRRLGVKDITEIKEEIKRYEDQFTIKDKEYDISASKLSIANEELAKIEDGHLLKSEVKKLTKKVSKMKDILNDDSVESTDPDYYIDKINKLEKREVYLNTKKDSDEVLIQSYLTRLEELNDSVHSLSIQYEKENKTDNEVKSLRKELTNLNNKIESSELNLGNFVPEITKDEMDKFLIFLKTNELNLRRTYEFDTASIRKVIDLRRKRKNVDKYINNALRDIEYDHTKSDLFISRLNKKYKFNKNKIPDDCKNEKCIARELFNELSLAVKPPEKTTETSESDIQTLDFVNHNIDVILNGFKDYDSIIKRLPDNIKEDFLLDNIYDRFYKEKPLYDEKKIGSFYSMINEYENLSKLKQRREEVLSFIEKVKETDNTDYILSELNKTKDQIEDYEDKIKSSKSDINDIDEELIDIERNKDTYNDLKDAFSKFDELSTELDEKEKLLESYNKNNDISSRENINCNRIKLEKQFITDKIQELNYKKSQFEELSKELKSYSNIYDEMGLVKDSLSSTKGIPLRYIKYYLGNTEEITNELLDIAYHGDIFIDKFNITQTEFTIPFYNKGKYLDDVKYASQGETSFISIALAFALSSQAMHDYNIMLLDEIDSTLDSSHREKFIKILENQIDRINAEQCFFITHGNMFSSYPVDVVSFGDEENELYKGSIEIERK